MDTMPTLGLTMIVKNEAAVLGECLASVRAIVDTIVIADTGSTDDTVAIAESHGARVVTVPWTDDFAAARNAALAHLDTDWVLQLDGDEVLDPDGTARIRALVDGDGLGADAIEVIQANYSRSVRAWRWTPCDAADSYARGFLGYIAAPVVRLFRNHRGYQYREAIHETITASLREAKAVVRSEPILIHHYGYAEAESGDPERLDLYLRIARNKASDHPDDAKAWFDLCEQALAASRADEAEAAARNAVALAPGNLDAAMALAKLLLNRGALDEARSYLAPLALSPSAPAQVLNALGAVDTRLGRYNEARGVLERSVALEPRHPLGHAALARALDLLGEDDRAAAHLALAAAAAPGMAEFERLRQSHDLRRDGEALFGRGDYRGALQRFVEALRLDPDDPLCHMNLGVCSAALGDRDQARRCLERAARLAPGHPGPAEHLARLDGPS